MKESLTVARLVEVLRNNGKTDQQIISILSTIVHSQILYGGSLQSKLDYYFNLSER
jgi:hypothetical protein